MKLFAITPEETFTEYVETGFETQHQESILEDWLENNPHSIIEDGTLLILGRQVTTNVDSFIDLLAIDRQGDVAVIELKRDRTPRETLAQALEYASFVEPLDYDQLESIFQSYLDDASANLAQYHHDYFGLATDEAVVFNKDQRVVIIGQRITPLVRQTSSFLRQKGLRVTCVEFTLFETEEGLRLLSTDIVVGKEATAPSRISSRSLPRTSESQFMEALDEYGRPVFATLLAFAKDEGLAIHWGTKGFSLNVDLDGNHTVFAYGYPPHCVFKQSVYTALVGNGGLLSKIDASDAVIRELLADTEETGLFEPAGHEYKCPIDHAFSQADMDRLLSWCQRMIGAIKEHGLRD